MSSLRALLEEAGFHGHGLDMAVSIAMAESGGHPMSHNTNAGTGDNSYGLFQINMLGSLGPARLAEYHLTSNNQLFDPLTNAKVAYQMSQGGTNWTPWSTYKSGAYERYLGPNVDTQVDSSHDPDVIDTPFSSTDTGAVPTTADDPASHNGTTHGTGFEIGTGHSLTSMDTLSEHHAEELAYSLGYGPQPGPLDTGMPAGGGAGTDPGALGTGMGTGTGAADPANQDALQTFLHAAVAQRGDSYVFGAKGTGQANPTAFDCSGLTAWAAHEAGVELPAGAAYQYVALKQQGMVIPVDQAIHTPGALLFHFATEPQPGMQGEPPIAHVAISLGNGKTIEAADPQDGVTEFNAGGGRFNYAAIIPGIGDLPPSTDTTAGHAPLDDSTHPLDATATDPGDDPFGHSMNSSVWQDFSDRLGHFHGHGLHPDEGTHHGHGDHGIGADDHGLDIGHH
jgi:cell wall-associated NlpC family hydrolase